ncbi:hypothetical protein ACRAWF_17250 [Streptomyces sp. L7]
MLISDVSLVVADFVASLKPYSVPDQCTTLPDDDFRAAYTTAGGAYLLDRDCTRLPEILRSVREPRHDPMAPHRHDFKEKVSDRPSSMERFKHRRQHAGRQAAAER